MFVAHDGFMVPARFEHVAEIIDDYDPNLELVWIPPDQRTAFDSKPFGVLDRRGNHIIFTCSEDEVDERLIARIFNMDTKRHDVISQIEANERAAQVLRLKEKMEAAAEAQEFATWAIKSKAGVKHNGVRYE